MKTPITIEYTSGESATYVAAPPEWAKWEIKTGFTVSQAEDKIGINDLLFLAYHAMKREKAGQAVKPFDIWCETVSDIKTGISESPKATPSEA
jgi:hypothetical protein